MVRRLDCDCIAANPAAQNRVEVTSAEGARDSSINTTVIERPPPSPVPRRNPDPPVPAPLGGPGTGRLDLSIIATDPSISLNGETTFIIALRNDQNTFLRNVVVSFALPDGIAYRDGVATTAELGPPQLNNGEYQFLPIAELRPGGERVFRVTVVGRQVGRHRVEARAQAGRDTPETEAAEVFVNP